MTRSERASSGDLELGELEPCAWRAWWARLARRGCGRSSSRLSKERGLAMIE